MNRLDWKAMKHEDLVSLIKNTAHKMKVRETIVEKDYWVCFTLDYLFHECQWSDSFIFKGGTSLSKCFGLLDRFSEDIDLILDWTLLGYTKDEPWETRSNTKQGRFNEEINQKTETFLAESFVNQMKKDLEEIVEERFQIVIDDNNLQTVLFYYPKAFSSNYVETAIRLEIGALAAWSPSEVAWLEPYIAKEYPQIFKESNISVKAVSAVRTFWEKATILHHEANRPEDLLMPCRYARHYYDMYCLANSIYKDRAFEQLHLLEKVAQFKNKFYPRNWAKYDEATPAKIKLLPEHYRYEALKNDYEQMEEMFMGISPEFDDIMDTIRTLEKEIHRL